MKIQWKLKLHQDPGARGDSNGMLLILDMIVVEKLFKKQWGML